MITAIDVEVRASAQLLLAHASFRIAAGDKVGLVGRNGAGKTTLTRILAGEAQPAGGTVTRTGSVGYLPQDPRAGNPEISARDRILSARGLDAVVAGMRAAELQIASADLSAHERGMSRYARLPHHADNRAALGKAALIGAAIDNPAQLPSALAEYRDARPVVRPVLASPGDLRAWEAAARDLAPGATVPATR